MDILSIKVYVGEVLNFITKPLFCFVILIVWCGLCFLPIPQFDNFKSEYNNIIISVGLIYAVILIYHFLAWGILKCKACQEKRHAILELKTLSSYEKDILMQAVNENTTTIYTSLNTPGVIPLRDKKIIKLCGEFNPLQQTYIIPNHIWIHLRKNKAILGE